MNRITIALVVAAGCAADRAPELASTEQHAERHDREYVQCSSIACRMFRALDRDGDGVADIDEAAIGTDPDSAIDRPSARDLYERIGAGGLPTWNLGLMTIVVLPTHAPDGTEVFGGESGKPAREELIKMLKLGDVFGSFDLSHGLVINSAFGGPDLGTPGLAMRDDPSLYMAGGSGMASDLGKMSPNQQVVENIIHGMQSDGAAGMSFGTMQIVRRDGATDDIHWESLDGKQKGTLVSRDKNGAVNGTGSITSSTSTSDGVTTTVTETTFSGRSGTAHVKTELVESGADTFEHTDWETTNKKTGERQTGSSTTHTQDGEEDQKHWVKVDYDKGGKAKVTSSDGTKEQDAIQDASVSGPGAAAYRDPDYIEPDPDMAAAELYIDQGPIHIFQDPAGPSGPTTTPMGNGVLIMTTGDDVEGPCCGRVNLAGPVLLRDDYVMRHVQPDYDPSLAEPPPEQLPDVGTCLECSQ